MGASIDRYYDAFLASQEYLLQCDDINFPIDIKALIERHGRILLQTKTEYDSWCLANNKPLYNDIDDAKCFYDPNRDVYLIVYNNRKSVFRTRFSLAHELGHIVLEHLNQETLSLAYGNQPDYRYMRLEGEANIFAGNILAPPIVIDSFYHRSPDYISLQIGVVFGLSQEAARKRLADYKIWKTLRKSHFEYELGDRLRFNSVFDPAWL